MNPHHVVVQEVDYPAVVLDEMNSPAAGVVMEMNLPAVVVEKEMNHPTVVEKITPLPHTLSCFEGDCLNYRHKNRYNRVMKEQGQEAMKHMLCIPGDAMNEALISSDSDEYRLDTSSYDEEDIVPPKRQRKMTRKRKRLRHSMEQCFGQVNGSDGVEEAQTGVGEDTAEVEGLCDTEDDQDLEEEPCNVDDLEASNSKKRRKGDEEIKCVDLQELKACLEADYHSFYNGLSQGNCEGQCDNIKNEDEPYLAF
ncbi:hypothetical protein PR048_005322 [Dryococelus australis]|uniref:Uncharacterized protein n=1 Tax=Dryococelus australis TaxID=614101 RepID=A0ABQ9I7Y4_9NEOP|nr:hypothetical protein PR048_005322 [Dryococelus australis]